MNIGLGLGLQGTPDMHLGMVKSRQAAKDKYDAAKQKKQADQIDRLYRDFTKSIEGKRYLPVDERNVNQASAEWYDFVRNQVESGNPDMNSISEMTYNVQSQATKANAQREMFEKVMTNGRENGIFPEDLLPFLSESDPNKLEEASLKGSGAVGYNKQTKEIVYDLIPKYTPVESQMQQFVKDYKDLIFNTTEMPGESYNINGQSIRHGYINPDTKSFFIDNATSGENLRSLQREFSADPDNRGLPRPDPTTEEGMNTLKNYAGEAFDSAANALLRQEIFKKPGSYRNIFNIGPQEGGVNTVMTTPQRNNIYSRTDIKDKLGLDVNLTATSQGGITIGTQEFPTSVPYNTVNSETREPVLASRGIIRAAKISIYPTAKKSVKIKTPIPNRPGEFYEFNVIAGEVIPDQLLPYYAKTSGIEYKKIVEAEFSKTGQKDWIPVTYPVTDDIESLAYQKLSKEKASSFDNSVKELNDLLVEINKLAPEIQAELYTKYTGNIVDNVEEIRQEYILPNKPDKGKAGGSGNKGNTGSGTPSYGDKKSDMLTNQQWKEMRKKKGQSTDFNSWNEYKKTFNK
jgi:hypothetical protein